MPRQFFRAKYRNEAAGGDDPSRFQDRLCRMSADPALKWKVSSLISAAYATARSKTLEEAIGSGAQVHHLGMRLRHLHDALGQHVHDACHGSIYRSRAAEDLMKSGRAGRDQLHCEHAIPINIASRLIYKCRDIPLHDFATFMLTRTPVVAITREERHGAMGVKRSGGTSKKSKWSKHHPCYPDGEPANPDAVLPFARYLDTGIEIVRWPDEVVPNPSRYTMSDHVAGTRFVKLYDVATYADELDLLRQ